MTINQCDGCRIRNHRPPYPSGPIGCTAHLYGKRRLPDHNADYETKYLDFTTIAQAIVTVWKLEAKT